VKHAQSYYTSLIYKVETWTQLKADINRLMAVEMGFLRSKEERNQGR
jgi:hypothetical protein